MPGSVTLLGGEPGIGKSTLVLQVCAGLAAGGVRCLVVTGEESADQVGRRAQRLGVGVDDVMLLAETDIESIIAAVDSVSPDLVIIDSVQTMSAAGVGAAAGTVSQVRECAQALAALAKQREIAVMLVGHVTKEGTLAGPRVLEHLVDTVLEFEGDRHQGLRFLRAVKHRFGATDEVGVFAMQERGLESVSDASGLFLDDRRPGTPGSAVFPAMQGRRPMLVEVQALTAETSAVPPQPRRVAQGIDGQRLAVILAVVSRRAFISVGLQDVFVSVVGGVRLDEPAADLAVALAVVSSLSDQPLNPDTVFIGEIGLGGEVRKVPGLERRLSEAQRMGFKSAIVPPGETDGPKGLSVTHVSTLQEAVKTLGLHSSKS